jgi:ATP-dependent Clp protease, protease subunit
VRERISQVIANETGQPIEKVRADMERDYWMSADEAIAYGIVSRVVVNQKELG